MPLLLLLLGCSRPEVAAPPAPPPALAAWMTPTRPAVIAHRGGSALGPEETLPTFAASVSAGADFLEMDVHATADGVVVCMHDAEVDRTTDGQGLITELSFEALRALDAGYAFTPDAGASFPWRGRGVQVPTLAEVLAAHPELPFVVEIKQTEPPIVEDVLQVLREAGATQRVILASFDTETIEAARRAPEAPATSLSAGEVFDYLFLAGEDEPAPGRFLQIPPAALGMDLVTPEQLQRAEALGLSVQVWTVRERAEAERLVTAGVHGMMGPDPGMLRGVVDALP
ncbi:MAG: glycerophosphodiester phosphodiesterase [Alphaproteobacteria bacterium]|nr:glycerophosphodiester phosphodiesterase [Alphaproteobacteria bacterium]MCB9791242.1 glycerophosphodiester phosphodiesterase [Alphaproteobacteria bacterium]